jgi:hypothetical protein
LACFAQTTLVVPVGPGVGVTYHATVDVGVPWWVDLGNGTRLARVGTGADQSADCAYAGGATYVARLTIANPGALRAFDCASQGLSGTIRSVADFRNLASVSWANNAFTGPPPDVSALTSAWLIALVGNSFAGTLTAIPPAVQLWFSGYNAGIVGSLPSLTACTALVMLDSDSSGLTGYTASTLAPTITSFLLHGNALTEAAVDQILADLATNVAARPAVVVVALDGGTSAAPSAAGLASIATIMAAKPGWTITTN